MNERQLLERAKQGDRAALRRIFEDHKRDVYGLALGFTGNHHDAEDVVQETFYKFYRSLKRFRGDAKIRSWLYRITVNACLDRTRKKGPLLARNDQGEDEALVNQAVDRDPLRNPERVWRSLDIRRQIKQAVAQLTPLERAIFVLRHYRELPLLEIAQVLERSEGTIKSILFRTIRKLRNRLEPLQEPVEGVKP